MKLDMFGCNRFQRLVSEARDRELSLAEDGFLQKHRQICEPCRTSEQDAAMALDMLRMASLDPEVDPNFDVRVIRRLQVQSSRESVRYWSPAVVGALIAGISVVAALQLISRSVEVPQNNSPIGEARNYQQKRHFPRFDLDRPDSVVR